MGRSNIYYIAVHVFTIFISLFQTQLVALADETGYPEPKPARLHKHDIYIAKDFKYVDERARKVKLALRVDLVKILKQPNFGILRRFML